MAESILIVEGLTKEYQKKKVVNDVSMEIQKGDIYGFIGVNGAGKSTFMRMLCGLAKPTAGSISLFGANDNTGLEKARRRLGALIEHPALYINMTAMANLEIQRRYLDVDFGKNPKLKMQELLELVGLEDVENKKVRDFSMGMQQRLGLAVALIGNPEFLILDEPYVGLDPVGVLELRELLQKLNREKQLTIFFSSHNLDQMTLLATRFGFLHNGKLMNEFSAEELEYKRGATSLETLFTSMVSSWEKGARR